MAPLREGLRASGQTQEAGVPQVIPAPQDGFLHAVPQVSIPPSISPPCVPPPYGLLAAEGPGRALIAGGSGGGAKAEVAPAVQDAAALPVVKWWKDEALTFGVFPHLQHNAAGSG